MFAHLDPTLAVADNTGCKHTGHSNRRQDQRNISDESIAFAMDYGTPYKLGARRIAYFVSKVSLRDAKADRDPRAKRKHLNVCVITCCNTVITVMRRTSIRAIRRKSIS